MERTFVMIKPDGVQRGLIGEVISRLERKGLKLRAMKFTQLTRAQAERHYAIHKEKPFFDSLVHFITSGPVVPMVWEGPAAVDVVRTLLGVTDGRKATPGTIRGDLGIDIGMNLVHASDSSEAADEEMAIYFTEADFVTWNHDLARWFAE